MASENSTNIEDLIEKAKNGDPVAQCRLGVKYYYGFDVEQNYIKALEWFEKSALQNNSDAQDRLGDMYYYGNDVDQDYVKALEWYEKSAQQGNSCAQYNLGGMYYYGKGVEQNYDKALKWYEKSAQQGNSCAQYSLGGMYYYGKGVEQNYDKALEWYEKSAQQGNEFAQGSLGHMYYYGKGVEQNYSKAFEWFEKQAMSDEDVGYFVAQNFLGIMYENGLGVEQNYAKALEWYEKAGGQWNFECAQCNLGLMYYNGHGVEQNYTKAFEWFKKAADQDYSVGQYFLGVMYGDGLGVDQNYAKALEWYEKSAEQNESDAQFNLGWMYYEGKGTEQSYENAVYWWEKSAAQDDAEAQFCLSCMYRDGLGVEKNAEKAKELWEKCKDSIDSERFYVLNEKFPKIEADEEKTSMCNDNEYEIKNVKIVPGTSLEKYWKSDMQVVATDKGDFIDKLPNVGGHDWQKEIGKCIECEIRESKGHKWISLLSDSKIYKGRTTRNSFDNNPAERLEELPPDYDLNENPELVKAYEAIKQNTPVVFLTGGAGTGKSTFIKFLKNNLKADMNKNYVVLAPTGVAAINVGGQTIHSFFGWKDDVPDDKEIVKGLNKSSVIDYTDLIIIDEISMVHSWMIDNIDKALRFKCDKTKPFGGKQLLLIGDCFQLPPVVEDKNLEKKKYCSQWSSPFFFAADALKKLSNIKAFQLKKIYRQENDQRFIHILNRIRECKDGYEKDIEYLNENCLIETRLGTKNVPPESLLLCTTKEKADEFNNKKLFNLVNKGKQSITYKAFIEGDFHYDNKRFLTKDSLDICVGAKIMLTKNINSEHLVNGDMGIVLGFGGTGNSLNDYVDIEVKGIKHHITRQTWEKQKYEWNSAAKTISQKVVGTFNQIPLTLGWAVTIHKSQGLTLNSVAIDAPDAWDSGQVYVALSRAKTIDGVLLCQKIPFSAIKVDSYVQAKYKELFPDDEDDEVVNVEIDYREKLSNEGFSVDKTEQITSVRIGGYEFELYPSIGEKIQDHVKNVFSCLLADNLIPDFEMQRLMKDKDYCYETFGIVGNNSARIRYVLLSRNKEDFYDSYYDKYKCWKNNYSGYYICSQWYQSCADKFARWLIELSKGNLDISSVALAIKNDTSYTEDGNDFANKRREEDEKKFAAYIKQQKETEERLKRSREYAPINTKFLFDSVPTTSIPNSSNVDNIKKKKVNKISKDEPPKVELPKDEPLEMFVGKYVDWEYIGNRMCHKFLLENGSILYATDHGGRGRLPKTGNMVKIKIYEKWNDTAIKWKVESVD